VGGDRGFAAGIAADGRREAGAVYTMLLIVVEKHCKMMLLNNILVRWPVRCNDLQ
jgi:hypothetical protein